ncbi:MAG TPA: NAD(P)H-hydrate dehydratase [Verrucomicrobiae bacterium]|jgi:NAD(P)H-hydrate epimerase
MPIPVITLAQMRAWERATWAGGQTEAEVIRRVGKRIARRARKLTKAGDTILILAGKGHNGDDARAAKAHLDGRKVKFLELLLPGSDLLKVEMALREKPALIIDGMFGIGLNRPLAEAWQKIIAAVNATSIPVLAVDIPSGLNAETGEHFGAAIKATVTLTVGAPKTGLLMPAASTFVGRLELADDIGLIACSAKSELNWTLPEDFEQFPPTRPAAGHKGTFGHATLIAGSLGFHGAGVLTAHGAQRAQPGLVTLFTQPEVFVPVAAQLAAAMVNVWSPEIELPKNASAFLIGPGLAAKKDSETLKHFTRQLWRETPVPLVVDASALDFLTSDSFPANAIRVLTPHPGEAARLLETTTEKVQANRVQSLRDLSKKFGGCWVILKGNQTLVGRAEGDIFVNLSGNPHLAQGGSGDLLAGYLTGLLAQSNLQTEVLKTLRYAVWQHGATADQLQADRKNWIIEDLAREIGNTV